MKRENRAIGNGICGIKLETQTVIPIIILKFLAIGTVPVPSHRIGSRQRSDSKSGLARNKARLRAKPQPWDILRPRRARAFPRRLRMCLVKKNPWSETCDADAANTMYDVRRDYRVTSLPRVVAHTR